MRDRKAREETEAEGPREVPGEPALAAAPGPERILALQQSIGNAAVARMIARADAGTQAHDHAAEAKDPRTEVDQIAKFFPEGSISRKLVYHYGAGSGDDYELTEAEMRELKPYINFFDAARFGQVIQVAARQRQEHDAHPSFPAPMPAVLNHKGLGVSTIGGGLGTFTVHILGELTVEPSAKPGEMRAVVKGDMDFYDVWDFDPKPLETAIGTSNRTKMGEAKTIVGSMMRGKPFKVTSKPIAVTQTSDDAEATW